MLKLAMQPSVGREPVTFQETPACILPVRKGQRWKAPAKNTLNEGGVRFVIPHAVAIWVVKRSAEFEPSFPRFRVGTQARTLRVL